MKNRLLPPPVQILLILMLSFYSINLSAQSGQKWATGGNGTSSGDFLGTTNAMPLVFKTNNTEQIKVDVNGNIYFRSFVSAAPSLVLADQHGVLYKLPLPGSANVFLSGNGTFIDVAQYTGWKLAGNDMIFLPSGNLGIGTNSPHEKVDILGNLRVTGRIYVTDGITILGKASGEKFESDTMQTKVMQMDSTSVIVGETRVDGDGSYTGSLGLGITNPSEKLEVAGNIKASGTIYAGQLSIANGIIASGLSSNTVIKFQVPSGIAATINTDGQMGIGTQSPTEKLEVAGNVKVDGKMIVNRISTMDSVLYLGDSSIVIGTGWTSGNEFGGYRIYTKNSNNTLSGLAIGMNAFASSAPYAFAVGNFAKALKPQSVAIGKNMINTIENTFMIGFNTSPSITPTLFVGPAGVGSLTGNVGIGTTLTSNPNPYKLAVKGTIGAWEVIIENTSAAWSDFVFDKDYELLSLYDLEKYIAKNKHLPDVPSASEVQDKGINVAKMDATLLKKIEELTLYTIVQQKQIDLLIKKVETLEKNQKP
jgi:hypothetical protein